MKQDIHQEVTNSIIRALEEGNVPWHKPWKGGGGGLPQRSTGEHYNGINVLILWSASMEHGFSNDHWFTYQQAKKLGAQVTKGSKSTTVIYYSTFKKEDATGKIETIPFMKSYRVFNADQIEGLPEKYSTPKEENTSTITPIETLETFFNSTGAIIHHGGNKAFYTPADDFIRMPERDTFHNAMGYYSTLAHECIHWTGHAKRLDRLGKFSNEKEYAFEELVAEIGSCFLTARLNYEPNFDQSGAYIKTWLKALKSDKRFIFKASSKASAAANYLFEAQQEAVKAA